MKVLFAFAGIGAALLPLRRGSFLGALGRMLLSDGKSGDEEITMTESCWSILTGDESWGVLVAIAASTVEGRMRRAHRTFVKDDSMEIDILLRVEKWSK